MPLWLYVFVCLCVCVLSVCACALCFLLCLCLWVRYFFKINFVTHWSVTIIILKNHPSHKRSSTCFFRFVFHSLLGLTLILKNDRHIIFSGKPGWSHSSFPTRTRAEKYDGEVPEKGPTMSGSEKKAWHSQAFISSQTWSGNFLQSGRGVGPLFPGSSPAQTNNKKKMPPLCK